MSNKNQIFRAFSACIIASAIILIGCSDPKDYEVAKLTEAQRAEMGKKLTADEGAKLTAWMIRNVFTGKEPPAGITIREAIQEQDKWLTKEKEEEAIAAEIKKKIEVERVAKQAEFDRLVSVTLINKKNTEQEYGQKFISLDIAYQNKSEKEIAGIKGVLKINDIFGDTIKNYSWSYDDGVPANQTITDKNMGVEINRFSDEDSKLWNTDYEKLKSKFEVSTIIFKDGSKVDAPE